MLAISILQPWAWLIVRPDITDPVARAEAYQRGRIKDIENRVWYTNIRGRVLVHTGKTYTPAQHSVAETMVYDAFGIELPAFEQLPRGGVVGSVEIVDCVGQSESRWHVPSHFGFRLANAQPLPFMPYRGQLGFFEVPYAQETRR